MLVGQKLVEGFQGRSEISVDQEEDGFGHDVGHEDEDGAHQMGHGEPLLTKQLKFNLKKNLKGNIANILVTNSAIILNNCILSMK